MPIPMLSLEGFLPDGVFDCTLEEVRARFGTVQKTDQRPKLFSRLEELVAEMKSTGFFGHLVIGGSFVTAKAVANDIDLVAVLRPGIDLEKNLPVSQYALLSRAMMRRRFGFDVSVVEKDSSLHKTCLLFFSRVRELPSERKGALRISLL